MISFGIFDGVKGRVGFFLRSFFRVILGLEG